ncbi:MAG: Glu/Leu/Phe/Val dehydrogenase, partial [Candidatus Latescibacterota bacterium]
MKSDREIVRVRDDESGLDAWIAIDTLVHGESSGGLRMTADVCEEELRRLAHTMTLKYGFLGFPKGGAKAGIRFDGEKEPEKARVLLGRFGRAARPLIEKRRYFPGPDMGTDEDAIRLVLREAGVLDRENRLWRWAESGPFTGTGVAGAFLAAAERLAIPPSERSVSIEGLGAVGLGSARRLAARGVRIVGASNRYGCVHVPGGLDPERWSAFVRAEGPAKIARFPGARSVSREEFLGLPVTAFLPCAIADSLTVRNEALLGARLVVPGANNPTTPEARIALERRGVVVLPDFVTNAGGVLGGALAFAGLPVDRAADRVEAVLAGAVRSLLAKAEAKGIAPVLL